MVDTQFNNSEIVIIGAGGLAREIISWHNTSKKNLNTTIVGLLDDDLIALDKFNLKEKILGKVDFSLINNSFDMEFIERAQAPTPKFFKILRTIGLALLAVSGAILTAPVALPVLVVTIAGYTAVAGGVLSAVSQVTVDDSKKKGAEEKEKLPDGQ